MKKLLQKPAVLIFAGITLFYLYMSQGLVLWDDDYGLWQKQLQGLSWFDLMVNRLLSPLAYDDSSWGFTERPLQLLVARICFGIGGTHPLPFYIYRSLSMGALAALIWLWMDELNLSRFAKPAALLFIFTAPNTMAAFCWHADFVPTAEALYALSLLIFIRLLSRLPDAPFQSLLRDKKTLRSWALLALLVYIGYKSKANLKLIPFVFLGAALCVRRKAISWVGLWSALLILMAIPWSAQTLSKLPPWFPGSGGSQVAWMYQESGGLGKAYTWLLGTQDAKAALYSKAFYPLSLFEIFGLCGVLLGAFLILDYLFGRAPAQKQDSSKERIALVVLIFWFLAELAGSTALADINPFFKLRYSLILLIPFAMLSGYMITRLQASAALSEGRLKQGLLILTGVVILYQARLNLERGFRYRSSMAGMMSVIDQAYRYIDKEHPEGQLLMLPGFRNYAPPVNSSPALLKRLEVGTMEIALRFPPETYGLAWGDKAIAGFELEKTFWGCPGPKILNIGGLCEAPLSLYKRVGGSK